MQIHVVRGDRKQTFPGDDGFLHRLPTPQEFVQRLSGLTVGVNTSASAADLLPSRSNHRMEVCNQEFRLWLPEWMQVPQSTSSRSTSHAQYIAQGDWAPNEAEPKRRVGVLLQVLPEGKETSCHSHPPIEAIGHPGTIEFFLPLSTPAPLLYTPEGAQHIPSEGCWVDIGVPHQLQAADADTLTLIIMWEMHHVTWMGGHVPHNPPFVPYTI